MLINNVIQTKLSVNVHCKLIFQSLKRRFGRELRSEVPVHVSEGKIVVDDVLRLDSKLWKLIGLALSVRMRIHLIKYY